MYHLTTVQLKFALGDLIGPKAMFPYLERKHVTLYHCNDFKCIIVTPNKEKKRTTILRFLSGSKTTFTSALSGNRSVAIAVVIPKRVRPESCARRLASSQRTSWIRRPRKALVTTAGS